MAASASHSVEVLVLTPNAQVPEFTVELNLDWSVAHLKQHLCDHHPTHPQPEEQKLVYAGRLLLNHLKFRDILPQYRLSERQAIHLVVAASALSRSMSTPTGGAVAAPASASASPAAAAAVPSPLSSGTNASGDSAATLLQRNQSAPQPATSPDGLRHRVVPGQHPLSPQQQMMYNPYMYQQWMYQQYYGANAAGAYHALHGSPSQQSSGMATPEHANAPAQPAAVGGAAAAAAAAAAPPNPAAGDNRFAQAGLGAAPVANDQDLDELGYARTIPAQIALIAKLLFLVFLFGQHASEFRFYCICFAAVAIFFYQSGRLNWLWPREQRQAQQQPPQQRQQQDADAGDQQGNEAENGATDSEEEDEDDLPPPPQSVWTEVANIVGGFLGSLMPHRHYERVH